MGTANLRAFLFLIRWCEGTSDENGYRALYGHTKDNPKLFNSFADHPRVYFNTQWGPTSAAGAYQMLAGTFDDARRALSLPDFSPESQDKAAVWLIERRKALQDVEAGNLELALYKCASEWASMPDSPYGQPTRTLESCRVVFERAGGKISQAAGAASPQGPVLSPSPGTVPPAPSLKEKIVAIPALVTAAASALLPFIADLMRERGSKTSTRNAEILDRAPELAPIIMELGKAVVPDAKNEQEVVERIVESKDLQGQLRAQAAMQWSDIKPYLEFDEASRDKARSFAAIVTTGDGWRSVGAGVLIGILSITVVVGGGFMFYQLMHSPELGAEQKGMILGALVAGWTAVLTFWFGSSSSSRMKDQTIAEQAKGK